MAVILQKKGELDWSYLLHSLGAYAEVLKDDPGQAALREAVLALLSAMVDEEVLLITGRGVYWVALAVLHYAAQHGRSLESDSLLGELTPLAVVR